MEIIQKTSDWKWTDFFCAARLRARSTLWEKGIFSCLFLCFAVYSTPRLLEYESTPAFLVVVFVIFWMMWIGVMLIDFVLAGIMAIIAYYNFKAYKKMGERDTRFVVDEAGISATSDIAQFQLTWKQYKMWRENKRMIIVRFRHTRQHLTFPRRLFQSDEQWDAFRSILSRNLKKR